MPVHLAPLAAPSRQGTVLPFPTRSAERLLLSPPVLAGGEMESLRATLEAGWLAPAVPELSLIHI